jgi:hypothetical protein
VARPSGYGGRAIVRRAFEWKRLSFCGCPHREAGKIGTGFGPTACPAEKQVRRQAPDLFKHTELATPGLCCGFAPLGSRGQGASDHAAQLGCHYSGPWNKDTLPRSSSVGRCDEVAGGRPIEQVVREHTVELCTVAKTEAGPETRNFGTPLKQRVFGEQVQPSSLRNETERFEIQVIDYLKGSLRSDQFELRQVDVGTSVYKRFERQPIEAINDGSLNGTRRQGEKKR